MKPQIMYCTIITSPTLPRPLRVGGAKFVVGTRAIFHYRIVKNCSPGKGEFGKIGDKKFPDSEVPFLRAKEKNSVEIRRDGYSGFLNFSERFRSFSLERGIYLRRQRDTSEEQLVAVQRGILGRVEEVVVQGEGLRDGGEERRRRLHVQIWRSQDRQADLSGHGHGMGDLLMQLRAGSRRRMDYVGRHIARLALHELLEHEGVRLFDERLVEMGIVGGCCGGRGGGGFAGRVRPPVRDQVALAHEILGAEVAAEGPVRRSVFLVRPRVKHEIALEREGLAALGTHVRPVPRVRLHMLDQVLLGRERGRTNNAVVLGALNVLAHVTLQVLLPGERSIAVFTTVRGFTCMDTNMIC